MTNLRFAIFKIEKFLWKSEMKLLKLKKYFRLLKTKGLKMSKQKSLKFELFYTDHIID